MCANMSAGGTAGWVAWEAVCAIGRAYSCLARGPGSVECLTKLNVNVRAVTFFYSL